MDRTDEDVAARRALAALVGLEVDPADPSDVFELQHAEGAGASGRVFRACQRADPSAIVALKVIPIPSPSASASPSSAVAAVAREIAFLRACDHPNVVAFQGAYYKAGALWLAMEHCAGGSAASVRARGPLSENQIAVVLRGALRGLAYLHARRKLHRDVKGANILLTSDGRVKLADFGVSAQLVGTDSALLAAENASDSRSEEGEEDTVPAFQRGTFVGTPYWMSPEMIQDGAYDHKADIWSLGVTAIELADREPPLFREHPMRALLQIPRHAPPTVRDPSQWSEGFLDFVRFVLRKNPRERPTAAECLRHAFLRRDEHEDSVFAAGDAVGTMEDGGGHCETDGHKVDILVDELADVEASKGARAGPDARDERADERADEPSVAAADAPKSSRSLCIAIRGAEDDELLDLSVDEASETDTRPVQPLKISASSPKPLALVRADSLVRRPKASSAALSDLLGDLSVELREPVCGSDGRSDASNSSSPSLSSLNPLAQIDAPTTGSRVSALLASLSSSRAGSLSHGRSLSVSDSVTARQPGAEPLPPVALLRRSSMGLSVSPSFREARTHSRASSTTVQASSASVPSPSVTWRELQPHQFGAPIDALQPEGGASVPSILHLLRRELLARDALQSTRWIYRASPDARELERVRAAVDRGAAGLDVAAVSDANVFASLLKLWLRKLPAPLLAPLRAADVRSVAQLATADSVDGPSTRAPLAEVHECVDRALAGIHGRRRAVLEWLLDHWLEVLRFTTSNRMTAHALAVVMAPSVYACGIGHVDTRTDGEAAVGDVVAMLRVLLHWRRACRDTGFVDVVDRLESADSELRDGGESAAAVSLVWPADSARGASRAGLAVLSGVESALPLDKMFQECVSLAVGPVDEADSSGAPQRLEIERFEAFRRSVADALVSAAKTPDEAAVALRFRSVALEHEACSDSWTQLSHELPPVFASQERWLAAAASFEAFQAMAQHVREVSGKRRRLRELRASRSTACPLSDGLGGALTARIGAARGRLDALRSHLASSRHRLEDAAKRVTSMNGDRGEDDRVPALVTLAQAEPLVELVLLAALQQPADRSASRERNETLEE